DDEENVMLIDNHDDEDNDTNSFIFHRNNESDLFVDETQEKFAQLKINRDEDNKNYNNPLVDFLESNRYDSTEKETNLSQTPIIEQNQTSYHYNSHDPYTGQDFRQTELHKKDATGNFAELYHHFYTKDGFVRDLSAFVNLEQLVIFLERNIHTLASEVTVLLPSIIELVVKYVPAFEIVFVENYNFNGNQFYGIINVAELLNDLDAGLGVRGVTGEQEEDAREFLKLLAEDDEEPDEEDDTEISDSDFSEKRTTTSSTTTKSNNNDIRVKAKDGERDELESNMSFNIEYNADVNDVSDVESITTEGGEWHYV
ncbi:6833_t:CDS:2, partial [Ambispora leptoticha]